MRRSTEEKASRSRIRRLGPEDEAELVSVEQIARACFEEAFSTAEELGRPWARLWAAWLDEIEDPVGFLIAWHVADELHVLNVATMPAMRRRGVARALMDEALGYAAAHKVRIVILEVRRSNRAAIKLYRGLGFTALGVRPGYYSNNNEDAIEMILGMDPDTGRVLPGRDEIRLEG